MIREKISVYKEYLKFSSISEISRRYFVMNSFDGALTMLGIIVGSYMSGKMTLSLVLGAGFGASFAMAISGLSGAYMTERAERRRDLKELERSMQRNMENSMHAKAMRVATIWGAIVSGAPLLTGLIALMPFLLASFNLLSPLKAVYISVGLVMLMLFILGIFLGRISKENLIVSGFKTLIIGFVTAVILIAIGSVTG